jgi:hypothetical protein
MAQKEPDDDNGTRYAQRPRENIFHLFSFLEFESGELILVLHVAGPLPALQKFLRHIFDPHDNRQK